MKIADSGNRTEFASGAVRDIQEGKGRCDLLPLELLGGAVAENIACFQEFGKLGFLELAILGFMEERNWDVCTMLLEVAIHFEEGAKKYGERNWQKGIPVVRYVDSAIRHYLKWKRGDQDEPHDRAFCWNILCAAWTCKHMPELNDYRKDK